MNPLERYTETVMSYQCGFDVVVDGDENPLKEAVYVKKENRCGTLLERNYFSATYQRKNKNWIERCIYCSTTDDLEELNGAKDLVRRARKVCPECNANQSLPLQLYGKRDFLLLNKKKSTLNSKAKKNLLSSVVMKVVMKVVFSVVMKVVMKKFVQIDYITNEDTISYHRLNYE